MSVSFAIWRQTSEQDNLRRPQTQGVTLGARQTSIKRFRPILRRPELQNLHYVVEFGAMHVQIVQPERQLSVRRHGSSIRYLASISKILALTSKHVMALISMQNTECSLTISLAQNQLVAISADK